MNCYLSIIFQDKGGTCLKIVNTSPVMGIDIYGVCSEPGVFLHLFKPHNSTPSRRHLNAHFSTGEDGLFVLGQKADQW